MSENKNMRELSMDEMDKVSGGGDGKGYAAAIDGKGYSEDFVLSMGRNMAETFGFDVAADTLIAMFGLHPHEKDKCGGSNDVERIEVLVNRIFTINEHVQDYGTSNW